jgi:hypothetical protein
LGLTSEQYSQFIEALDLIFSQIKPKSSTATSGLRHRNAAAQAASVSEAAAYE